MLEGGGRKAALAALAFAIFGAAIFLAVRSSSGHSSELFDALKGLAIGAFYVTVIALRFVGIFRPRPSEPEVRDPGLRKSFAAIVRGVPGLILRDGHWKTGEGVTVRIEGKTKLVLDWLPAGLSIRSRSGKAKSLVTGDPNFDLQFEVQGLPVEVRSRLSADARQKFRTLAALMRNTQLDDGTFSGEVPVEFRDPRGLESVLRVAIGFAQAIGGPLDDERLCRIAAEDPSPGVRRLALEELSTMECGAAAVEKALSDADPSVRLFAAQRVGERGRPLMAAIAEEETAPESVRAEALRGARALPRDAFEPILRRLLRDRAPAVQLAAIVATEALRWPELVPALSGMAPNVSEPAAIAIAKALGAIGVPAGEPPLVRFLEHGDADVRAAAIAALGTMGGAGAVEPLRSIGSADALAAIDRIQARLIGADVGQLTVATEGGELSEATGAGAISLARARSRERS